MSKLVSVLRDVYIRFLIWLGAEAPPGYEHLLPGEGRTREYTLKEGETIFSVARKFGIHYDRIAKANGIENPEAVQPGQGLIIPPDDWDPASGPLIETPPATEEEPGPEIEEKPETGPDETGIAKTGAITETKMPEPETAPPVLPPTPPKPVEIPLPVAPEEEPDLEELDWLAAVEKTGQAISSAEEPTLLPDEVIEAPDTLPTEIALPGGGVPPVDEPEWLLAAEPAVETEAVDETLSAAKSASLSDRLEWLTTPKPVVAEPQTPVQEALPVETPPASSEPVSPVAQPPELEEVVDQDMIFRYEIQRGDTLSAIAKRYALTVKELIEANDIADPNRIFPGQKLAIPGYMSPKPQPQPEPLQETPPPMPDEFFVYTVAEGDTLSAIAKRYGVTVRELVEINNIRESNLIRVGQRLFIPGIIQPPDVHPEEPSPQPEPEPPPQPKPTPQPSVEIDPSFPPAGPIEAIRALYVSYFAIGHTDFRRRVFDLLDTTEFNAVVIDAKGDYGWISYPTQIPLAREIDAARPTAKDFDAVLAQFKARGVYTIARVVAFKDNPLAKSRPDYALKIQGSGVIWQDREDLGWSDPFLKPVWDYNIQIAIEAAKKGFDEIQFDYVRFPTASQAGPPQFSQEVTKETRIAAITSFLSTVRGQLKPFGVKVAADTFGYTCWRKDDTLIGQDIERMGQYLDVLSPMLYPSTFGSGIPGYKFAIAHPYEIVYESAKRALERVGQSGCVVRPWIQDFPDYRFDKRVYGKEEIQAQIKGCFDAGSTGFMVWDPRVRYTDGAYAPMRQP